MKSGMSLFVSIYSLLCHIILLVCSFLIDLPDEMSGIGHREKMRAVDLTCGEKCSKLFNLKRHFERHHPEGDVTLLDDLGSGICSCQSCHFKCFHMKEFRRHLNEKHGLIFRVENISFHNYLGTNDTTQSFNNLGF